jgi:aminoglycoside 3-N-acetyltransferase
MREVSREQVISALRTVGVRSGNGLLVHSAIQFLGQPQGGVAMYLEAIQEVIGPQGTLAVPTFNFAFARGERYDPVNTPSAEMGVFAEYVRQRPGARRTSHPMQSIAILGNYADDLASRDTRSAFDPGSAFERMYELGFKLLFLGADIRATSIVHYSEQRAHVPYRYWKDFSGEVRIPVGWETRTYRMFVRDLEMNPVLTADPILKLLQERCQWLTTSLNYGQVTACRLTDMVAAVDDLLAADPWALVTNRDQAIQTYHKRHDDAKTDR